MSFGVEIYNSSGTAIIRPDKSTYVCVQSAPHAEGSILLLPSDLLVHTGRVFDSYDIFGMEESRDRFIIEGRLAIFRKKSLVPAPTVNYGIEVKDSAGVTVYHSGEYPLIFWGGGGTPALVYQQIRKEWIGVHLYASYQEGHFKTINGQGVITTTVDRINAAGFEINTPLTGISSTPTIVDISSIPVTYKHPAVPSVIL